MLLPTWGSISLIRNFASLFNILNCPVLFMSKLRGHIHRKFLNSLLPFLFNFMTSTYLPSSLCVGTIAIIFSICYSFVLNHLFKNVCIAEFLENKGGVFLWSRGQVCVLPNIIKTMSPSKAKVEQVFVKPILKKLAFPKLGVPQLRWKPTLYAASTWASLYHKQRQCKCEWSRLSLTQECHVIC